MQNDVKLIIDAVMDKTMHPVEAIKHMVVMKKADKDKFNKQTVNCATKHEQWRQFVDICAPLIIEENYTKPLDADKYNMLKGFYNPKNIERYYNEIQKYKEKLGAK